MFGQGVPLRMELGPRDVAKGATFCARRIGGDKFSMAVDETFEDQVDRVMEEIQSEMYHVAETRLKERTRRVTQYSEMKTLLENGETSFFLVPWKDNAENEEKVKEECKVTIR